MPSFNHKQLLKQLNDLDTLPKSDEEVAKWVTAESHLNFLIENSKSQEIVVFASPEYSFIHSMAVPEDLLDPLDKDDLLQWSLSPYTTAASYVSGGGRNDIWVERNAGGTGSTILSRGTHLIYGRTFEGWTGDDADYFELSQEYAHLEDLHWRPEQRAYCKFDENGDLAPLVSITKRTSDNKISLVTFERSSLENYLTASRQALVRLFDFTLLNRSSFTEWCHSNEKLFSESDEIFFRQNATGNKGYTRGVQIIRPKRPSSTIYREMKESWFGEKSKKHVEFTAYDWRNKCITKISTSPDKSTNYFEAQNNNLPFELSPAFFKPEVLLKYKGDKDKYTVGERDIYCRASWRLKAFDVNDAGQVFAYICYLRRLPENELLHWLSYNEEPKTQISERAFTNDFEGKFVSFTDPLERIKDIVRDWETNNYSWWKLRDDSLIDKVSVPLTSSRDEWGESFLALTQLVNEGFVIKVIRRYLKDNEITFDEKEGSLALLEKWIKFDSKLEDGYRLNGLRMAQKIRSTVKGHSAKSQAEQLAMEAISSHETFAAHFRNICETVIDELENIQDGFEKTIKVNA